MYHAEAVGNIIVIDQFGHVHEDFIDDLTKNDLANMRCIYLDFHDKRQGLRSCACEIFAKHLTQTIKPTIIIKKPF